MQIAISIKFLEESGYVVWKKQFKYTASVVYLASTLTRIACI